MERSNIRAAAFSDSTVGDANALTEVKDMTEEMAKLHAVESCNLGKLPGNGIALKINFTAGGNKAQDHPLQSAAFALPLPVALGLAKALLAICEEVPENPGPSRN